MKKNTPKLMILPALLLLAACGGVNTPTTADSTTLYTGPLPKTSATSKKDTIAIDSLLKMGPDNFTARDSLNQAGNGKKAASTE